MLIYKGEAVMKIRYYVCKQILYNLKNDKIIYKKIQFPSEYL